MLLEIQMGSSSHASPAAGLVQQGLGMGAQAWFVTPWIVSCHRFFQCGWLSSAHSGKTYRG